MENLYNKEIRKKKKERSSKGEGKTTKGSYMFIHINEIRIFYFYVCFVIGL